MLLFEQTPRTTAHSIFFKTKGKCWYYTVCSSLILMKRPTLTTHFFTIDAMVFTYSLPSSSIWYGILLNCTTTTTGSFLIKKKVFKNCTAIKLGHALAPHRAPDDWNRSIYTESYLPIIRLLHEWRTCMVDEDNGFVRRAVVVSM